MERCSPRLLGNALHPPDPPGWVGSASRCSRQPPFLGGRGPCPGPQRRAGPHGEAGGGQGAWGARGSGGPGGLGGRGGRVRLLPPALDPSSSGYLRSRGGRRGPREISRGLCIFPAQPISLRNRIKFIDLSTHYLFRQLRCGGGGGGKGRSPRAPRAPRGLQRPESDGGVAGPASRDRPRSAARSGKKGGWGAPPPAPQGSRGVRARPSPGAGRHSPAVGSRISL